MRRFTVVNVHVYPVRGRQRARADGHVEVYWDARRSRDGSRQTVWSGWATRQEAERIVTELVLLAPVEEARRPGSLTFLLNDWFHADVANRGDITPLTRIRYQNAMRHLATGLGHHRASTLSLGQVTAYRDARLAAGAATGTVQAEFKRLRAMWSWARMSRRVPDRDLPMPKLRVTPKREKYTPTRAEVQAVIERLEAMWAVVALRLLLATGARISEIAELTWADVGPEELSLPAKGGGRRRFPRTQTVNDALALATRGVGSDTVTGTSPHRVRAKLGPEIRRAGGLFTPHGVRRCVEDYLAEQGADIADYAALLGHSPKVALEHYRRSSRGTRSRTASLLDD